MPCHSVLRILAVGIWIVSTASAFAVPIPGLFNTGVDNSNTPLTAGSVDPHWVLSAAPSGGGGPNAIATGSQPGPWVADTSDSKWISNAQDASSIQPAGGYRYDQTFDLTGLDHNSAVVTGDWASDNASQVLLNNAPMQIHPGGTGAFSSFASFSLTTGFVPGINQLSVVVSNDPFGPIGTPTGLHVDNLQGSAPLVPEPTTLALGFVGLLFTTLRPTSFQSKG